jgi:hypothetical protein
LLLVLILGISSADALLFREAQLISGTTSDRMQKPSIGFDYINKLADDTGEYGTASLQMRANWINETKKIELTPYNAYLKFKNAAANVWIGHYRPPFGLSANESSHATLLAPLSMDALGSELAWGVGLERDELWGDVKLAATQGSRLTGRIGYGVLNEDNWTTGLFFSGTPQQTITGIDTTYLIDSWEFRGEYISHGGLGRIGYNFDEQNKLELQQNFLADMHALAAAYTYKATSTLTFRASATKMDNDMQYLAQVYYYGL